MLVKNRIKKHAEFQSIIEKGSLEKENTLYMYYNNNTLGYLRIGISVPKKSGNAVVRNKIKRQIRALCAKNADFTKSFDLVLIVRKAYDTKSFSKTEQDLNKLFSKLG